MANREAFERAFGLSSVDLAEAEEVDLSEAFQ